MGCLLTSRYVPLSVFNGQSQQNFHLEEFIDLEKMWSTFTVERSIINKIPWIFLFIYTPASQFCLSFK